MRPLLVTLTLTSILSAQSPGITGFTSANAAAESEREKRFDSTLRRDNIQQWLKRLSSKPHHLGSPAGKEVAEFVAAQFKSWGYETSIETFYPLFPTPKLRSLELTAPTHYTARLDEPVLPEDATSGVRENQLPTYNSYSADGDVTGELVYVNYGVPSDYEALAQRGIDVKGKIVLARYGHSWRGIKPKVAAEHGAIGCIIYSDPQDDGYGAGEVYPKGGYRTEWSAQRGSVMDMPTYSGDPLTPFIGATKDAVRLPREKAATIMKIPVLPIAWGDALPLLKALGGTVAPPQFRGGLPITYHIGPGPATVHLKLEFDWKLAPAYDVIARMPGSELADEWVLRGNHHDGWVFGAEDPLSGLVPMMEEARAVAELVKTGWKPKRTIMYLAWDGEEPSLLGSTEWAEQHAAELQKHAVAYINTDGSSRGFIELGGTHTLEHFANEAGRDVIDPERKVSAMDRYRARMAARGGADEKKKAHDRGDIAISPLGSGSDFTPFLQHLGIAALNIGFGGEGAGGGAYHSIYDSYDHFIKFNDPDFQYELALAQLSGRMTMRLADADSLPFRFDGFVRAVGSYIDEIAKLADTMRSETVEFNRSLADHSFELAADPLTPYVAPAPKVEVPHLNFAPLRNALAKLEKSAKSFRDREGKANTLSLETRKSLDQALMQCDRVLLRPEGLPRRPWYRHQIYAPGYYTGYGVKTIPGVREAVEERRWAEFDQQVTAAAQSLEDMAKQIDRATTLLAGN